MALSAIRSKPILDERLDMSDEKKTNDQKKAKVNARYRKIWLSAVLITGIVALTPLIISTVVNHTQTKNTAENDAELRVRSMVQQTRRNLEHFLTQRRAALTLVSRNRTPEELSDPQQLAIVFDNLKDVLGGIVDLGYVGPDGQQVAYIGPFDLLNKDYSDSDWFHQVQLRGHHISDVELGYREFPHCAIAVAHEREGSQSYCLRTTIDVDFFPQQLRSLGLESPSEAFIINREGILQTPSLAFGDLLTKCKLPVPDYSEQWVTKEFTDENGDRCILGYAFVRESPFVFIMVKHPLAYMKNWFVLKRNLWLFLLASMIVIVLIVTLTAYYMVQKIRQADIHSAQVSHDVQYTNKMASIGRLAAGVAHEINNPLAIINEKAGMLKDLTMAEDSVPDRESTLKLTESVLAAVERCSRITRRLLGFAKHMDVSIETIELGPFIKEVVGFLEHEARYRKIKTDIRVEPDVPVIHSDRGQLQQVFVNILNNSLNALSAIERPGFIRICLKKDSEKAVSITVADNGPGIPEHLLKNIFEPFFTTHSEGTGLGLSITYGIVEKLGGKIEVESEMGKGTAFKITLPISSIDEGLANG